MAATTEKKEEEILLSPIGRTTYLKIWTPGESKNENKKTGKKDKIYEGTLLFYFTDPANPIQSAGLGKMLKAAQECAKDKWGAKLEPNGAGPHKKGEWFKGIKSPFRFPNDDSYKEAEHPEYENAIRVPMRSYNIQPKVCYNDAERTLIELQTDFYSGCYAIAWLRCYAYSNESDGVSFGVNAFIKMKDGEPFSGGSVDVSKGFASIPVSEDGGPDNSHMLPEDV
jgi:hypothetical protein